MSFFVEKTRVIDAMQYTGTNFSDLKAWLSENDYQPGPLIIERGMFDNLNITGFVNGRRQWVEHVPPGNWVIKSSDGKWTLLVLPDALFQKIYAPANGAGS